ncbi:DNA replication protein [Haloferax namakaokahaiae]|uniref:DNA replication protein n=1 Tax=Haloferax namakaokahaiae TaxID=1748331 RepID=A0ABD5ZAG7_9EURY
MNVDELRSVLRTERQKDSLQHLRESFYEDVAELIAEQKARREQRAEELGTHYSSEIRRITDEIETTEEIVTSIYERRVGKVVKAASFAAAGMPTDTDGLTHEEKRLFDDLVARIEENRSTVLSTLEDVSAAAGTTPTSGGSATASDSQRPEPTTTQTEPSPAAKPDDSPPIPPDDPDPEVGESADATDAAGDILADAMGTGSDDTGATTDETSTDAATTDAPATAADSSTPETDRPTDEATVVIGDEPVASAESSTATESTSDLDSDRTTVRITADVGTIFGIDEREYDLAQEDVVTLPSANAGPLVERGAAEKLD